MKSSTIAPTSRPILAYVSTAAIVAGFLAAALILALSFLATPNRPAYKPFAVAKTAPSLVQPEEDEPGWDCRRVGVNSNGVCGWEITVGDDIKAGA